MTSGSGERMSFTRGQSGPVVFQGEHLACCTLGTQVAVWTEWSPLTTTRIPSVQCGWLGEVGGATRGGCKLYNNQQQQCYLIFISAEPGIARLCPQLTPAQPGDNATQERRGEWHVSIMKGNFSIRLQKVRVN